MAKLGVGQLWLADTVYLRGPLTGSGDVIVDAAGLAKEHDVFELPSDDILSQRAPAVSTQEGRIAITPENGSIRRPA